MDVRIDIDWDLLLQKLVLTVKFSFFTFHWIFHWVQVNVFVFIQVVFLPDVMKLQLGAYCLSDDVFELV